MLTQLRHSYGLRLSWNNNIHLRKINWSLEMQVSFALFRIVQERCLWRINNNRTFSGSTDFGGGSQECTIQSGRTTAWRPMVFNYRRHEIEPLRKRNGQGLGCTEDMIVRHTMSAVSLHGYFRKTTTWIQDKPTSSKVSSYMRTFVRRCREGKMMGNSYPTNVVHSDWNGSGIFQST